jgi:hypothetical protein
MIMQHTVTRRRDEYTYFFCRNRQRGACPAPYVNVAIAEDAVERYYAAISHQQITDAQATFANSDAADNSRGRPLGPVQFYRACTDDQRQLLNQALFRRLYLAEAEFVKVSETSGC